VIRNIGHFFLHRATCPASDFSLDGFFRHLYNGDLRPMGTPGAGNLRKLAVFSAALIVAGCVFGCRRITTRPVTTQVVVLGFDGTDPDLFSQWAKEGKLPNLAHLAQTGAFRTLGTTNPPESPVAWASFATGLNPGGTGIFDFLRRDPKTYLPELALVSREKPKFLFHLIPIKPPKLINERDGVPFYKAVADSGYKTTVVRMPLEFPPTSVPGGKLWAGLSVPDVRATWGTFFYFGTDLTQWDVGDTEFGGKLVRLEVNGHEASAEVEGPVDPTTDSYERVSVPVHFTTTPEGNAVAIQLGGRTETVAENQWSNWFRVKFKITPFLSVHAICQFYVLQVSPDLRIYMSPLDIDPESPAVPVSAPDDYTAELVKKHGLFKTLGWWHDTWALNEEKIDEGVFLDDTFRTMQTLADITLDELKNDPPSLLVSIFTATDSVSHMFFRLIDPKHPRYDPELAKKYGDAILWTYERMDKIVGDVLRAMKPGGTLIIVSDHGFHTWRKGFNTNTWLVQNGFMVLKNPGAEEKTYNLDELFGQGSFFPNVDWSRTKAYSLGLGQIYLNLRGRERFGIVEPGPEADRILEEIRKGLMAFKDPDTGGSVLQNVYLGREIFHGANMPEAPELQLDFRDGYRTSWQTSLGAIPPGIVVANMKKWSGDHCASDPSDTGGIFFSNRPLLGVAGRGKDADPSIIDIAPTVIQILGATPPGPLDGKPLELGPVPGQP
jgi:predicted AlkP superfamily phosphohydrolase/phosphomutase